MAQRDAPVTIKRYANRRLYHPADGRYVTLAEVAGTVRDDEEFVVHEAATGADVTRSVLKSIIIEQARHG